MSEPATEYTAEEKEVLGYSETGEESPATPAEAEPKKEAAAPEVKPAPEPSPEAPKEEPKKDETKPPPAAEPDAEKKFTQKDLEHHIKERLATRDRELETLRNDMTRLRGELDARRRDPDQRPEQIPATKQDLGLIFNDQAWAGWTLEKLAAYDEEYGTTHAVQAKAEIRALQRTEKLFTRQEQARRRADTERQEVEKFKTFKAKQPEYFTEASDVQRGDFLSTLTEKGRKLLDLMSTQEVYNWDLAHKLLNYEEEIGAAKKQAVADYIKENVSGTSPARGKPTGAASGEADTVAKMTDEKLVDAYDRAKGDRAKELRKELVRRGLLAPSED